ncbi:MAG TPA: 50S ribosomal protein L10 [Syntrophobacteraceae bacterium]|nr:50S ribosomal protein L10 [Syntrophobacteraceae bacterium]
MERIQKEQVVSELRDKLQRASAAILTDFKGMSVAEMSELREALAAQEVDYQVVKNTLMRLASRDTGMAVLEPHLKGTNAIAVGYRDPSVPAKILKKFNKTNEKLKIKAGVLGTRLLSPEQVSTLAELPPREELLAKLLGTLNAVPTGFVTVLSGVIRSFIGVLAAVKQKKEEQA